MTKTSTSFPKRLGPLPIINRFLDRLRVESFLGKYVPLTDLRLKLAPPLGWASCCATSWSRARPLYGLSDWASRFDERLLGLPPGAAQLLNDDRVGRCLDSLFLADRAPC